MRTLSCLASLVLLGAGSSRADTIYQINAQGKQVALQRDAIVVKEDSSSLTYKHFDLKERRVVRVHLNKGSLPLFVRTGNEADRRRIVEIWKRFGFKATITDQEGKSAQIFDAYLDFYPPRGRGSLLESIPPKTTIPVLIDGGGADEVEFSRIDRIEFQGERLKILLREAKAVKGTFLLPTDQPAEARLLGITDEYDPASQEVFDFSLPLDRLKAIKFEP